MKLVFIIFFSLDLNNNFDNFFFLFHYCLRTVCGQFAAFSTHTLTDTQWPWHVAIFIRSPPDHSAKTQRPHVMTLSDQQGAAEESTFWYLACSGALVTQRSAVVAAHCVVEKGTQQPLHPAHVKVIVGMKYHKTRDWRKSQQQLRVQLILLVYENQSICLIVFFCKSIFRNLTIEVFHV